MLIEIKKKKRKECQTERQPRSLHMNKDVGAYVEWMISLLHLHCPAVRLNFRFYRFIGEFLVFLFVINFGRSFLLLFSLSQHKWIRGNITTH